MKDMEMVEVEVSADGEEERVRLRRAPIMEAGNAVLLDINDGDRALFAHLTPSADVKIGKSNCSLAALIGCPYGTVFEVQYGGGKPRLQKLQQGNNAEQEQAREDAGEEAEDQHGRDNRNLVDNNTAQSLSSEDIENLRRAGASGKKIIDALIENSASFHSKTQYSQEKYKRKKQKKYSPQITTRRPSAQSVCEAYFMKSPQKIGFIRSDTLALLLSLANIGAHADVLILDLVGGLLTAAAAERVGGYGSICSTYHSPKPPSIDMIRLFNFDAATAASIQRASMADLITARAAESATTGKAHSDHAQRDAPGEPEPEPHSACMPLPERSCEGVEAPSEPSAKSSNGDAVNTAVDLQVQASSICPEPNGKAVKTNRPKPGRLASSEDISRWTRKGFSSLLVGAPDMNPCSVAEQVLPLLRGSASFAIYHPYLQPLAECMQALQQRRMAVALQLSEPWLREYQVLPARTHPQMQMNATGGYILSGIKIVQ